MLLAGGGRGRAPGQAERRARDAARDRQPSRLEREATNSDKKKKPDPAVYSLANQPARGAVQAGPDAWVERLVLAMINEAARCLEEEVVADAELLDLAMILGPPSCHLRPRP